MSVWVDLQGQESVVAQLRRAAQSGAPTHAWLLTGPPGSGRSNAALAFAAALVCEQPELAARGCGVCKACHTTMAGTNADVTFIATEKTTISIDEARSLVRKAHDSPSSARWRVMIVGDADRMAERTTNVLLKAIEEPPPRTIWILCAPSPADVLVTIRSRCRTLTLRLPPVDDVAALLVRRDGVEPGLALIGDAAHTIHPLAGQGVNLGFLDAAVLAEVLLHALERGEHLADSKVLGRFERRRMPHNLAMMAAMEGFERLFQADPLPLRWLRNSGLNLVDGANEAKALFVRQALGLSGDLPELARL